MTYLQSIAGLPFGFLLLVVVTLWVTVRDPRRVSAAILWGLTLNSLIITLVGALEGRLWELSEQVSAWVLLAMFAGIYLSVLVLALVLIGAGAKLVRLESFSISHSLALALGVGILLYLVAVPLVLSQNLVTLGVFLLLLGLPLGYLAFVLTSFLLYSWAYGRWASKFAPTPRVVVVLGAGLDGEDLTPLLRARADLGVKIYHECIAKGTDPILVGSGGQGADEAIAEGTAIGRYVRSQGAVNVVEETHSATTEQNLAFTRELVGQDTEPWMAVTSDYHAFRAAVLMRQMRISGNAVGARTPKYFWSSAVLREYVALLVRNWKLNAAALVLFGAPLLMFVVGLIRSGLGVAQ